MQVFFISFILYIQSLASIGYIDDNDQANNYNIEKHKSFLLLFEGKFRIYFQKNKYFYSKKRKFYKKAKQIFQFHLKIKYFFY